MKDERWKIKDELPDRPIFSHISLLSAFLFLRSKSSSFILRIMLRCQTNSRFDPTFHSHNAKRTSKFRCNYKSKYYEKYQ